jgi:hypothetical protein
MPDQHANFSYSTVATAPSPATSGTSVSVASGGTWPAVPFNVTVWPPGTIPLAANAEIVRVTASTGGSTPTFTIIRAQEASTAQAIAVGWQIAATITALTMQTAEMAGNGIDVTAPPYFIAQGTDQTTAINAMYAAAPDGTMFYWPTGTYMVGAGNVSLSIPAGRHYRNIGAGIEKTIFLTASPTADIVSIGDWYNTFEAISFHSTNTTTTAATALSTTATTIPITSNAGFGTSGTCYVGCSGSPPTWQLVSYTGTTATSLTGATLASGTATTINGGSVIYRTGGYCLNFGSNTNCYVETCGFYSQYNGVLINGTLCNVKDSVWANCVNSGLVFNGANVNSLVDNVTMNSSPPTAANVLVQQCGSLLISNSDIIGATNNLALDPTSPNGAFGVYSVNTYFDSSTGSSVKVFGSGNVQRVKFTNCWMSGSVSGFECNSTATILPTAFDFVNCDIYSNSANGILWTAGQDFSASNCRISGNATAGVSVVAATGGVTRVSLVNNRIGPTGNNGVNGTGVLLAAGTYAGINITGNDLTGNTVNINDGAAVAGFSQKNINNNLGLLPLGKLAIRTAASAALNTTETVILGGSATSGASILPIPANSLRVGDLIRIVLPGTCTTTVANISTFAVRIGTAGTVADALLLTAATTVASTTGTATAFRAEINLTVTAIGASAAVLGLLTVTNQSTAVGIIASGACNTVGTPTAFNSTVNNYLSVTYKSAATTTTSTFVGGYVEMV